MREIYYTDLLDNLRKLLVKQKQFDALPLHQKEPDQCARLIEGKNFVQLALAYLGIPRCNIEPQLQERLVLMEKQIRAYLQLGPDKRVILSQTQEQKESQHPGGHVDLVTQHQPPGASMTLIDHHANRALPLNVGCSFASVAEVAASTFLSSGAQTGISRTQQHIMNVLSSGLHLDSAAQGGSFNSLQCQPIDSSHQVGMGSIQNTTCGSYYNNINRQSQSCLNPFQVSASGIQPSPYLVQLQKQEEQRQLMENQQVKQPSPYHHTQQSNKQQQLQQQMLLEHRQQITTKLPGQHLQLLHQMSEVNDMKAKQDSCLKLGDCQKQLSTLRCNQALQLKEVDSIHVSSPQNLQASSSQRSQSSPGIDWKKVMPTLIDDGVSSQPVDSLLTTKSPSRSPSKSPSIPSVPVEPEKRQLCGLLSPSDAEQNGQLHTTSATLEAEVHACGTSAMSTLTLTAESAGSDSHPVKATAEKSSKTSYPTETLIKAVQSAVPEVLGSSIRDIRSVVDLDILASSAPGNGPKSAVGVNLAEWAKRFSSAENYEPEVESRRKKIRRCISTMPFINVPLTCGINGISDQVDSLDAYEKEFAATSTGQCRGNQVSSVVLEEIREINKRLIDTVVSVSEEEIDRIAAQAEGLEGLIVRFAFSAVSINPNLISQFASTHMIPVLSLSLLVPPDYPKCSPVLLSKLPDEQSKGSEDLPSKAMSKFNKFLQSVSQPILLGKMAKLWDTSIRELMVEYAHQYGGGTFSSRMVTWQTCVYD